MKVTTGVCVFFLAGCQGMSPNGTANLIQALSSSPTMANLLNSLSGNEQRQRQLALQEAARGSSGSTSQWASHDTGAAKATHAKYVKKGETINADGQKCSKVQETITMPNGKTGHSEELVCP